MHDCRHGWPKRSALWWRMAEFFQLSSADRLEAFNTAADTSGMSPHLLEKDIWLVWSLRHLFSGPHAEHLVSKGSTSLFKVGVVISLVGDGPNLTQA